VFARSHFRDLVKVPGLPSKTFDNEQPYVSKGGLLPGVNPSCCCHSGRGRKGKALPSLGIEQSSPYPHTGTGHGGTNPS